MTTNTIEVKSEQEYNHISFLGDGTYGSVSKYITSDHKIVAIKKYKQNIIQEGSFLSNIYTEIACLSKCCHPNIVSLLGVVLDGKNKNRCITGIVMPLASCNLYAFYKNTNYIDLPTIKSISYQIALGISHIHDLDILIGDIKPENVLIVMEYQQEESTNTKYHVKLCDFGMATFLIGRKGMIKTNNVYSPWYRSPEIISDNIFTHKAEVWAYGCVVYELVTRQALITPEDDQDAIEQLTALFGGYRWSLSTMTTKIEKTQITTDFSQQPQRVLATPTRHTLISTWSLIQRRLQPQIYEFLTKIFQIDYQQRPSMKEILSDSFFTDVDYKIQSLSPVVCNSNMWPTVTERTRKIIRKCIPLLIEYMRKDPHIIHIVIYLCRRACNDTYFNDFSSDDDELMVLSCAYITMILHDRIYEPSYVLSAWGYAPNITRTIIDKFLDMQTFVIKQVSGNLMPLVVSKRIEEIYSTEDTDFLACAKCISLIICMELSLSEDVIVTTSMQLAKRIMKGTIIKIIDSSLKSILETILIILDRSDPIINTALNTFIYGYITITAIRSTCGKLLECNNITIE